MLDDLAAVLSPKTLPVALATVASSLRAERMAETVVDSTVRIFDLISAIKDYSYMDQAPIQEVNLAESVETTLLMFQSRLQNVNVMRDYESGPSHINAYGSELNQVWTVLIENALDAVDAARRPGVLQLKTRLSGQIAMVEIWDNGPGIEPGLQSRIFEPFFTTKAPGHGLGLGLDTAQRIISKHSGYITVQSKPGETCFQVRLPLNRAEAY
jgi:signal transduction histidine kinase